MSTLVFDTLKLASKLEAGGFTSQQARTAAEALAESMGEGSGLATKADIRRIEDRIDALEDRITLRLIKWLLGVAAGATVVIIGAVGGMLRLMLPG